MTHTLWHGCTGSVRVRVVEEDVCLCVSVWGGWGAAACQKGPVCVPREARSYLARASATVSHTLYAPLPGGGEREDVKLSFLFLSNC